MQTPEDRFYNPARINGWFAVASVLALATTAAAILADHYDRQWKGFQESFHRMEKDRAEKAAGLRAGDPAAASAGAAAVRDRLLWPAGTSSGPSDLEPAAFEAALAAVKGEADFAEGAALAARSYEAEADSMRTPELRAQEQGLLADRRNAEDGWTDPAGQKFKGRFQLEREQRGLQALVDEHKFRMDHARSLGHGHEAEEAQKAWMDFFAREAATHAEMDDRSAGKAAANEALKGLLAPVSLREERARKLWDVLGVAAAERKIASWIAKGLRDSPLVDFVAPDAKIDQRVFPELTVDYNFAQVPRVDRCMTCHSGIDRVRVDPDAGTVTAVFGEKDAEGKEIPRVFRTHPRPELFVSSVSKHSLDRVGCTVCHEGLGWGLSFADAYHTPDTPEQEREWEEKYHWHAGESWTSPMLPMRHVEASCAKCHRDPASFAEADRFGKEIPGAPRWNRGQEIVRRSGCFGCHKIDGFAVPGLDRWIDDLEDPAARAEALATAARKPGPSLLRIGGKWSSPEAVWKWIWDPKHFRPTTPMPRFFGQPNNSGKDPITGIDYDLRTQTEVWGLVAFLRDTAEPFSPTLWKQEPDAANGKRLFGEKTIGCVGCHATKDFPNPLEGGKPNDFAPDLSSVGSKAGYAWLMDWILKPSHYWDGTKMPELRLTVPEAADIAAYLAGLRDPAWEAETPPPVNEAMVRDLALEAARATAKPGEDPGALVAKADLRERLRMVGRRAVTRYSCFGCHEIKGFEVADRIGTQLGGNEGWGSKDVDRLDFGQMEDREAVETFKDWGTGLIAERPGGDRALPHRKPEWARLKLLNPRVFDAGLTKQPHEKLLMPNFGFSEEDATDAVTFLLSLQRGEVPASKRPARGPREIQAEKMRWIAAQYNCAGCHTLKRFEIRLPDGSLDLHVRGGDIRPWVGEDADYWPPTLGGEGGERRSLRKNPDGSPADPVLVRALGEGFKVQPGWLFRFLRDPGKTTLRPWLTVRMPTFPLTESESNGLVHGFAADDGVPFPFEFEKVEELRGEERAEAKAFFDAIQCWRCHTTEGAPKPSGFAPDLPWARERLRPDWVRMWLVDPGALQPGTKMPVNWPPVPGGGVKAPSGLPREFFGNDPHRQMRRIADYVFDIGRPKGPGGN